MLIYICVNHDFIFFFFFNYPLTSEQSAAHTSDPAKVWYVVIDGAFQHLLKKWEWWIEAMHSRSITQQVANVKKSSHGKYLESQSTITNNVYFDPSDQEVCTLMNVIHSFITTL